MLDHYRSLNSHDLYGAYTARPEFENLQRSLGYDFSNPQLLLTSLTHKSFAFESSETRESLERLEFLGDSVLQLVITEILYKTHEDFSEGELSKKRSALVSQASLSAIAEELKIEQLILIGRGLESQGIKDQSKLKSDVVEAILGAVYLDSSVKTVTTVIKDLYKSTLGIDIFSNIKTCQKDYKTLLQELVQKEFQLLPEYKDQSITANEFLVSLWVQGHKLAESKSISKKQAQKKCAELAYKQLKNDLGEKHATH